MKKFNQDEKSAYHEIGHVFFAYYKKLFPIDEVCVLTEQEAIQKGLKADCRGATIPLKTKNEPYKSWVDYIEQGNAKLCVQEKGFLDFAQKYFDYSNGGWYGEQFYHNIVLGETEPIQKKGNHSDYNVCDNLKRLPGIIRSDRYDVLKEHKDVVIKLAKELVKNRVLKRKDIETILKEFHILN